MYKLLQYTTSTEKPPDRRSLDQGIESADWILSELDKDSTWQSVLRSVIIKLNEAGKINRQLWHKYKTIF